MDDDSSDEKIIKFFAEDSHAAAIQRKNIVLELLITADHLLNRQGAQLVSRQGKKVDVHPDTVKKYWELQSLIYDYIKEFGMNPSIGEVKNKWATPARKAYYGRD